MAHILKTVGNSTRDYDVTSYSGTSQQKNQLAIQAALDFFINKNFVSSGDTGEVRVMFGEGLGANDRWDLPADGILNGPTGTTTDATRFLTFSGSVPLSHGATDPLRPDATKGVLIEGGGDFVVAVSGMPAYTKYKNLQIRNLRSEFTSGPSTAVYPTASGQTNWAFERCIIWDGFSDSSSGYGLGLYCPVTMDWTVYRGTRIISANGSTLTMRNCTVLANTSRSVYLDMTLTAINSISHNLNTATSWSAPTGYGGSSTHNVSTDASGPSTSLIASVTSTNLFESLTGGSEDLRTKAGSWRLSGTDATAWAADGDIRGVSVPNPPDRGAWQLAADGVGYNKIRQSLHRFSGSPMHYYGG